MPRILRSAVKKREELELKRKNLKVKKSQLRKKSYELQQIIEHNRESLDKDIRKACSVFDINTTDSEESSEEADESVFVSEEKELDWDDQGDVRSPLKDTSDLLDTTFNFEEESESIPPALARRRSVSVSVNRARYIGLEPGGVLDLQPVCRNLNQSFGFENSSRLPSQESFLERNLRAKEVEALNIIEEEGNENENLIFDESIREEEDKMDEKTYESHMKNFKLKSTKVRKKIKLYTKEQVTVADANDYKDYLKVVRTALEELTEDITDVTAVLDANTELARIEELEKLLDEVTSEVLNNEKEVKLKMVELTSEDAAKKSKSEADTRADTLKAEKLKKRMSFLLKGQPKMKTKLEK